MDEKIIRQCCQCWNIWHYKLNRWVNAGFQGAIKGATHTYCDKCLAKKKKEMGK